jgi:hypothetical protein
MYSFKIKHVRFIRDLMAVDPMELPQSNGAILKIYVINFPPGVVIFTKA